MAKDPAFLWYPSDYLSGTMHLDFECKGAYVELLMLQFNKDRMSIHMIKHMLGHKFEHIWSHISDKFIEKDGFYWNERLRVEKENRINYCKSRKNNKTGGDHMSNHMLLHMEDRDIYSTISVLDSSSSVTNINIGFENFWNLYDKKVGDRTKLEKKWVGLKDKDRESIMAHIPKYKISQPDKKYRKNPDTYINNKSWNDEIITPNYIQNGNTNKSTSSGNRRADGINGAIASLKSELELRAKGEANTRGKV